MQTTCMDGLCQDIYKQIVKQSALCYEYILEVDINSKKIATNLTNPYLISATFQTYFLSPLSSFSDENIKEQVLQ